MSRYTECENYINEIQVPQNQDANENALGGINMNNEMVVPQESKEQKEEIKKELEDRDPNVNIVCMEACNMEDNPEEFVEAETIGTEEGEQDEINSYSV